MVAGVHRDCGRWALHLARPLLGVNTESRNHANSRRDSLAPCCAAGAATGRGSG